MIHLRAKEFHGLRQPSDAGRGSRKHALPRNSRTGTTSPHLDLGLLVSRTMSECIYINSSYSVCDNLLITAALRNEGTKSEVYFTVIFQHRDHAFSTGDGSRCIYTSCSKINISAQLSPLSKVSPGSPNWKCPHTPSLPGPKENL